jgi:hypothetical protein
VQFFEQPSEVLALAVALLLLLLLLLLLITDSALLYWAVVAS